MAIVKALCHVCTTGEAKYKCPGCRAPYCSAACYKQHKETPCAPASTAASAAPSTAAAATAAQVQPPPPTTAASSNSRQSHSATHKPAHEIEIDPEQLLTDAQLATLRSTPTVLDALADPVIRAQLTKIESSSDRTKELQKALLDPSFASFMYAALDGLPAKQ